jgi:hypothetical protein
MRRFAFLCTALIFGILNPLYATSVQRLSFDELVAKADSIVQGNVVAARTYRSSDGKLILTSYTVNVRQTLKGSPAKAVTLTTIGGRIGNTVLHVSGVPVFQQGEEAVLFLEQAGAFTTVVGLNQGKFGIANGEISNTTAGLSFPDGGPGKPLKMPVDEFKRQLQLRLTR